ncbi:uncharacterized protein LOC128674938 [Plodia interpunctella]|uniref:uncharacterized protein LOC128674938 n=1 Tax=Plodia interpunctella TaxID=58824 RepID=UPI00236780CB|nr:uncharacterized protein LOC128674938 [Plodia interpunctella]
MKSWLQCLLIYIVSGEAINIEKEEFCATLECEEEEAKRVCGIKEEGAGYKLKLFDSSCELLRYGCEVSESEAYGSINMEYCEHSFPIAQDAAPNVTSTDIHEDSVSPNDTITKKEELNPNCSDYSCQETQDLNYTCALRKDGNGFRIRLFKNICQLQKYNCQNNADFAKTDDYLCNDVELTEFDNEIDVPTTPVVQTVQKNLVIVDGWYLNHNGNINETIENFFAATHVLDLPVREIPGGEVGGARRMLLSKFGPQKVFQPWIQVPKNRTDDPQYKPTLSSCYHKCPTKCPDTYAPVCGMPGNVAREPSLMFQNHCFMDVAQCKMFWEDKSSTSESSAYIESSFMFCLGDEMNGMFRFLPLVRTLQHMGRLKKKGRFRYKLKNMRFFNNLLAKQPRLQG